MPAWLDAYAEAIEEIAANDFTLATHYNPGVSYISTPELAHLDHTPRGVDLEGTRARASALLAGMAADETLDLGSIADPTVSPAFKVHVEPVSGGAKLRLKVDDTHDKRHDAPQIMREKRIVRETLRLDVDSLSASARPRFWINLGFLQRTPDSSMPYSALRDNLVDALPRVIPLGPVTPVEK